MSNRIPSLFKGAVASTAAVAALMGIAVPAADAHPFEAPPPPVVRAVPVRTPFAVPARFIPAPPVVSVRPTITPAYRVPANVEGNVLARALSRLATLRAELDLSDAQVARLRPIFVQAAWQVQAIQSRGAATPARRRALRAVWQRVEMRVRASLTPSQRVRYARLQRQNHTNTWQDDGDGRWDGRDDDDHGRFDRVDFDRDGFDRDGFDRDGFDRNGFGRDGFDREGRDRDGCDHDGRDRNGFDRAGFDRDGRDRDGRDRDGRDSNGRDRDGRDRNGHDRDGDGRDGRDRDGRDGDGRDHDGRDGRDHGDRRS